MDAVILAAGLGTRLRPHTNTIPKPLLPVQGRPILDWIIGALPPEVDRLVVVTHYLAEQVDAYLAGQQHIRNWHTVRQEVPRGTGDALRVCKPFITSETLLVLNGDDLYGAADLAKLASKPAGILAHPVNEPRKFGVIFAKKDDPTRMDRLVEKPDMDGPALANIGAYVFPRTVFDLPLTLSKRNEYELTEWPDSLAKRGPFHIVEATFWLPIGTVEAWNEAQTADLSKAKQ
jgi:bifunctional UDP-N-acetylglucosamine pyrophosphorylase/glucosamine-1-phosphate N-acetyltransferase